MADHERIWLEPAGAPDRCWCQNNEWGDEGVEYLRVDIAASNKPVGIPDPDVMALSNGVISLHYEDLDAAQTAFDRIEAMLAASGESGR